MIQQSTGRSHTGSCEDFSETTRENFSCTAHFPRRARLGPGTLDLARGGVTMSLFRVEADIAWTAARQPTITAREELHHVDDTRRAEALAIQRKLQCTAKGHLGSSKITRPPCRQTGVGCQPTRASTRFLRCQRSVRPILLFRHTSRAADEYLRGNLGILFLWPQYLLAIMQTEEEEDLADTRMPRTGSASAVSGHLQRRLLSDQVLKGATTKAARWVVLRRRLF